MNTTEDYIQYFKTHSFSDIKNEYGRKSLNGEPLKKKIFNLDVVLSVLERDGMELGKLDLGSFLKIGPKAFKVALKQNGLALQFIHHFNQTEELQLIAVSQNGLALEHIRTADSDLNSIIRKIEKRYLPRVVKAALIQNAASFEIIKDVTPKVNKELFKDEFIGPLLRLHGEGNLRL